MPDRIGPKRVPSLHLTDFAVRDQQLLVAAARAWAKMAIIGFKAEMPFVAAVGLADALAAADARPGDLRAYSLIRIRGLSEAAEDDEFVRATR